MTLALGVPFNSARADTFYVRVDGGDASQCTGRSDAPYPGAGTAQACAWNHPFHALAPDGTRRIAGGDTLRIGGGSYRIGQGAPGAGTCLPANCSLATLPSGTSGASTRLLGDPSNPARLWGAAGVTRILSLDGSSYIEVGHLEITDQDDCVYNHSNTSVKCAAVGSGNWGKHGLYARASSRVWLHDLDIHGLGHTGLWAGGLTDWTIERVRLHHNGRAGWDANIGTGSGNAGAITLRQMEIAWNGCGERWQTGEAWACWSQQAGGYGDGVGTVATGGQWLVEDSFVHHNTQDGLDLRFLDGADSTHATLRRVLALGNAGNQVKVKGNALVENSVLIGTCGYFNGRDYMLAADHCRADGTTLLLVFTPNDVAVVRHNTITGQGWSLVGATEGDSSGRALVQNNVLVGFPWFLNPADLSRVQAGTSPAVVTHAGNLVWNVYANACPGDSVCGQPPRLANMALASFDGQPLADSPAVDRVAPMSDVSSDFLLNPRPRGAASDIGAYEIAPVVTCQRNAPLISLTGTTAAVPAGTAVTYTLTLANQDSAACASTTWTLADTVPAGWSSALGTTTLQVAPGDSGSTTLIVTSPVDAVAGTQTIGVGAASSVGAVHTASAGTLYDVQPAPVCTPAVPTLDLQGSTAAVPAGTGVDYTLVLTNNDSAACATTTFSLADTVPAGWTDTLAASQLALAPGATGSITLTVTSADDAEPGGYGIGAGTSSSTATHTTSASTVYTVQSPPPPCTRNVPSLQLTGPTTAVAAGTAVTYTLSLANNDSDTCTSTTFGLAETVPSGWSGTLAQTQLALAPGDSSSTTLTVTSAVDAPEGAHAIGAGASSSEGAQHTASASTLYTVAPPAPACTRAAPSLDITGPTAAVLAGTTVVYTVQLANNDSVGCTTTSFALAPSTPAGWTGALADTTLGLDPGASASVAFTVASTSDANAGDYTLGVGTSSGAGAVHTASASATYTVATPPPQCVRAAPLVSLSGSTTSVLAGTAVAYTLNVSNQDSAACATTSFNLTGSVPAGWNADLAVASLSLEPGASGSTTYTMTSATSAAPAPYTVGTNVGSNVGAVHAASATIAYTVATPPPQCVRAAPMVSLSGSTTSVLAGTAIAYTLNVSNQDSAACSSTSFNLTGSVPAGWNGNLAVSSLTLEPGASGSATYTVTSATSAAPAPYTVAVNVGSNVGAEHAASATITYTVATPPPQCVRAAPLVSLTGSTASVLAGTAVAYTLNVSNRDSTACASTSFNLTGSAPAGWNGNLAVSSLSLAPGASGGTTYTVTSTTNATAGPYTVGANVGSSAGAVHAASATITYTVATPPPQCVRAAPTLTLTGPATAVAAGTPVDYTLGLVNNDSAACTGTAFALSRTVPAGWTGTLTASSVTLAPGASGGTTLRVTSSTTATAGTYAVGVGAGSTVGAVHTRSASANYTVAAPTILLQTTLTTDLPSYARRATVQIAAQVRNNGSALSGVVVTFTLVRPGGVTTTLTATSGSDGIARTSYKVPNTKGALGTYTVTARWSFNGVAATPASTTFTVL